MTVLGPFPGETYSPEETMDERNDAIQHRSGGYSTASACSENWVAIVLDDAHPQPGRHPVC